MTTMTSTSEMMTENNSVCRRLNGSISQVKITSVKQINELPEEKERKNRKREKMEAINIKFCWLYGHV